ncbi:filament-like plant protein 3 isoform X2 [Ananas comosus]|uniref:Filament-like plant protein 3 isoform X2 n=1 Tax=Ananas comosus TaxID=4615 RepID=A0A6P5H146_ANACO|nr:filament-like plant protein 3 isoform X2 [Ananas comosus]
MDRRSWLWRRKSSEKSPGESESSGSVSSHSERYSDDQEVLRVQSDTASPSHAQSQEVTSNNGDNNDVQETVKTLTEKLSAALLSISAKEELVKQHAKVAEEAVSGWEQAETELASLKQQLEIAFQKNSALEDRINHLDGALKECVRQLRQSREEQEERTHDAISKRAREWESSKSELENQILDLKKQLETAASEAAPSPLQLNLQEKLEVIERENTDLKAELLAQAEDIRVLALERELSNRVAETASKQHLESVKKAAKLEAECRRLRAFSRKKAPIIDHRPIPQSVCVESLTDSLSDMDNEPECSDSWASALIAELDQFKNGKAGSRNLKTASVEIDLMDDFLEMERLVALPEADRRSSSFELETDSEKALLKDCFSKVEIESLRDELVELQAKVKKIESEKKELEMALADSKSHYEITHDKLKLADDELVQLHKQLELAYELKLASENEVMNVEAKRKELHYQLESANVEVGKQREKVRFLEQDLKAERDLSVKYATKVEALESTKNALEIQLETVNSEVGRLRELVGVLEGKIKEEKGLSAKFSIKIEASEAARKALESEVESARKEVRKLKEKVAFVEAEAEKERVISAKYAAEVETANLVLGNLREEIGLLEEQIEKEKAISEEFAAKCEKLEAQLSRHHREAELRLIANANGELKMKQEKELAVAAEKLADCQKTIASLGQQLKSLTDLDDIMLEAEIPQLIQSFGDHENGDDDTLHCYESSRNLHGFTLPNGKEKGSFPFSSISSSASASASTVSGLSRLLSYSRSNSAIEK